MADPIKIPPVLSASKSDPDMPALESAPAPQKAVKHGRAWTWAGSATIATSVVLLAASILIVCTLTTNLGNSFSKMGPGGTKMVNFMGQHANSFMIAGLAGSAASLAFIGIGLGFLYVGCRDAREADRLKKLHDRYQEQLDEANRAKPDDEAGKPAAEAERSRSPSPLRNVTPPPSRVDQEASNAGEVNKETAPPQTSAAAAGTPASAAEPARAPSPPPAPAAAVVVPLPPPAEQGEQGEEKKAV